MARIYRLYNTSNNATAGYFTSQDVAAESLKISYSSFEKVKLTQFNHEIMVKYTCANSRITQHFGLEPIDLITHPIHL